MKRMNGLIKIYIVNLVFIYVHCYNLTQFQRETFTHTGYHCMLDIFFSKTELFLLKSSKPALCTEKVQQIIGIHTYTCKINVT